MKYLPSIAAILVAGASAIWGSPQVAIIALIAAWLIYPED